MRIRHWISVLGLLVGCSAAPHAEIATYDFGMPRANNPAPPRLPVALTLAPVAAAPWLGGSDIVYRLAYEDSARPRAYSLSRWVAPPGALFTQRLQQRLDSSGAIAGTNDGVTTPYLLRMDLEEFSQVFDAPDSSRALVRVRATLIDATGRTLVAQQTFTVERPVTGSNAAGAVRSLRDASDGAVDSLLEWLGGELNRIAKSR